MTLASASDDFFLRASSLYPPLSETSSRASTPSVQLQPAKSKSRTAKQSRQMSNASRRSSVDDTNAAREGVPSKRRRVSPPALPNGRPSGACTRCKKLKVRLHVLGASDWLI